MPPHKERLNEETAPGVERRRAKYSNARTIWLREYKDAFGCANPACKDRTCTDLELDHVAKQTKSFETSRKIVTGIARKRYILELLKMQVICKKCHSLKTIDENMLPN
jgi:hypothetical protein